MKYTIVLLVAFVATTQARFLFQQEWELWKDYHSKQYTDEEEAKRHQIWQENFLYVTKHNLEAAQGQHTFTLDMNQFADLKTEEWAAFLLGTRTRNISESVCDQTFLADPNTHVYAKNVNWVKKGYVTPVKNQEQCGSCWAFSATGSLEGQHFKKTGDLVSLSEQNLVDCSKAEGNLGCSGGLMDNAFQYIKLKGIDSESSYPYKAENDPCEFSSKNVAATLKGCVDIEQGSESALMQAVSTVGPISVAIDAAHQSFQLYSEGIYYEEECSSTRLDHGVLAVGYGKEDGKDYWLVKNSWGRSWGLHGYIKMSRKRDNNCGIATQASYPLV